MASELVTDEELAEVGRLADEGDGGLLVRFAAEVRALRARLRTIDAELDNAGALVGPADIDGVYTTEGRVIALGLLLISERTEHDQIEAALRAQIEAMEDAYTRETTGLRTKLAVLREKARAHLDARAVLLDQGAYITGCRTDAAQCWTSTAIDLRAEVEKP